ncbi:MAG: histidine phosphatase family protein [Myxococcota bacterium]
MPKTVTLIRHAKSAVLDGVPEPDWPLTEQGHQQARDLVGLFADSSIAGVHASPFLRAVDTVRPLARALRITVRVHPDLRERHVQDTLIDPFEAFMDVMRRSFADPDFALPGGESNRQIADRGWAALEKILDTYDENEHIVVASHGNLISAMLQRLEPRIGFAFWQELPNPAIIMLERDTGGWQILDIP